MARDMYKIVAEARKNNTIDTHYSMTCVELIHLCTRCDSIDDRLDAINTAFDYGYILGQRATKSKRKRKRRINPAIKDFAIVAAVVVAGSYIWLQIALGLIGLR